jgi:hypothetical protein
LNLSAAINFYSAIVFWDEKRSIKSCVLNCLHLALLADWEFVTADARRLTQINRNISDIIGISENL